MGTAFDNNNPVVWRLGPRSAKDGIYLAMTDNPTPIRFNISDLSTIGNSEKKSLRVLICISFSYTNPSLINKSPP